jgi:hypothetical protein
VAEIFDQPIDTIEHGIKRDGEEIEFAAPRFHRHTTREVVGHDRLGRGPYCRKTALDDAPEPESDGVGSQAMLMSLFIEDLLYAAPPGAGC